MLIDTQNKLILYSIDIKYNIKKFTLMSILCLFKNKKKICSEYINKNKHRTRVTTKFSETPIKLPSHHYRVSCAIRLSNKQTKIQLFQKF